MAEYYLTSEVMPAIRQQVLKRLLATGLLVLGGLFCYSYFFLKGGLAATLLTCGLLAGALLYSYFRNVRQQQALAANYRLLLTPGAITRTQAPLPPIQLLPGEVTSITQNHAGVLTIATANKHRAVYVPVYISNRAELLQELAAYAPLTTLTSKTLLEKLIPYAGPVMLALMGTFYVVSDPLVSTLTGVLILGILAWSGWSTWRNPNLPPQIRRVLWALPLVFLSTLAILIARLQR